MRIVALILLLSGCAGPVQNNVADAVVTTAIFVKWVK